MCTLSNNYSKLTTAVEGCFVWAITLSSTHPADGVRYLLDNIPRVEEEFDVVSKIGEGTFSSVFLGRLKGRADLQFALKHLVPTSSSSRVESELRCLQSMG